MGGPGSGRKKDPPGATLGSAAGDVAIQRRFNVERAMARTAVNGAVSTVLTNTSVALQGVVCNSISRSRQELGIFPEDTDTKNKLIGCLVEKLFSDCPGVEVIGRNKASLLGPLLRWFCARMSPHVTQ